MDLLTTYELVDKLKHLGYNAYLVNGDAIEIEQNSKCHYLSYKEGLNLLSSNCNHPVTLTEYAEWRGLNYWYTFE